MHPRVNGGRAFSGRPPASARQWLYCAWTTRSMFVRSCRRIRVPTLILHRTEDRMVPLEHARYLARHIPGAKYVDSPARITFSSPETLGAVSYTHLTLPTSDLV